jgi:hypothetical protein
MKKIIEYIKKLSLPMKIQLIIALICTVAIPVSAWFLIRDRIEAFTKIKEPPAINIASGGADPALYISLENIDVSSGTDKYIVFSIEPGKYNAYDIQLSHTTNIPFTYRLYRVQEDENGTIEYIDHTIAGGEETTLMYSIITDATGTTDGEVTLTNINPDDNSTGRILGDESDLAVSRRNYDAVNDEVNQYAKPLYSIARNLPQLNENEDGSSERDYYAIRISWIPGASNMIESNAGYWNYAFNNKETDIIYISSKYSVTTE